MIIIIFLFDNVYVCMQNSLLFFSIVEGKSFNEVLFIKYNV